jgi:hypothetical protein
MIFAGFRDFFVFYAVHLRWGLLVSNAFVCLAFGFVVEVNLVLYLIFYFFRHKMSELMTGQILQNLVYSILVLGIFLVIGSLGYIHEYYLAYLLFTDSSLLYFGVNAVLAIQIVYNFGNKVNHFTSVKFCIILFLRFNVVPIYFENLYGRDSSLLIQILSTLILYF